jgi:hypothetical protein
MLQIINLDNVQVCYTHPGEGRRGRDGMVVGSTTICDKVCQLKHDSISGDDQELFSYSIRRVKIKRQ